MYAYLRGRIASKAAEYIVVDVQGVGYKVFVPERMRGNLPLNEEATVFTYLQVRDDALSLYGFTDAETLTLFELLLTVTGIGPKVALSIVNGADASRLYQAIVTNDLAMLTKVPGVGKKTAQRLVLELKEKIGALGLGASFESDTESAPADQDVAAQAAAALISLGYRPEEAEGALRFTIRSRPEQAQSLDSLLREALKYLGSSAR
ncbi:MAG: Holliday junction branch migration protein RuvA [Bacillota bacterium]|jgi:Holliday junction DNA helicase RuvA